MDIALLCFQIMYLGSARTCIAGTAQLLGSHFRKKLAPSVAMATAAADVKPFYFQDILELQQKPDVPYKKLTGLFVP